MHCLNKNKFEHCFEAEKKTNLNLKGFFKIIFQFGKTKVFVRLEEFDRLESLSLELERKVTMAQSGTSRNNNDYPLFKGEMPA